MTIEHVARLNMLQLSHGDIKEANIFICAQGSTIISTDCGSLTPLTKRKVDPDDPEPLYRRKAYTPSYCSQDHITNRYRTAR